MLLPKTPKGESQLFFILFCFLVSPNILLLCWAECSVLLQSLMLVFSLVWQRFIICMSPMSSIFCRLGSHITHASVNNVSGYASYVMKYLFTVTGYIILVHLLVCPEPIYINYILSNTLIIYRCCKPPLWIHQEWLYNCCCLSQW